MKKNRPIFVPTPLGQQPMLPWPHRLPSELAGLSKREAFAMSFLAAILQNGEAEDAKHNAIVAVRNADELIKQLNK